MIYYHYLYLYFFTWDILFIKQKKDVILLKHKN